jgi:hypothetical protein
MGTETLRLTLWAVAGFLMAAGVIGVGLALLLGKSAELSAEAARPVKRQDAPAAAAAREAPVEPVDEKVLAARKATYRQGFMVFVGLAVLTALEFWIASATGGSVAFLFLIALAKAGLIVQTYMHLRNLWGEAEAHG